MRKEGSSGLLDFLLQLVKRLRAEKLAQRHVQTIAELLDEVDGHLLAVWVEHAVHAGRGYACMIGQFVWFDATFSTDFPKAFGYGLFYAH